MDFSNKAVIVTGASSGIGAAIGKKFVEHGANVVTLQRNPCPVAATYHIETNLLEADQCADAMAKAIDYLGQLDVLVNNAGIMYQSSIEDMTLESWQETLQVNLTAPFLLTKYALSALQETRGNIVNIGSIEGLAANPKHSAYCASKAGLHGLTRSIAVDYGEAGIRCNTVAPGWIDTPLNVDFINAMDNPDKFKNSIKDIHPLRRTGDVTEVANLVCWLASDQASFVTGQLFTADGGRTAQLSLPHT